MVIIIIMVVVIVMLLITLKTRYMLRKQRRKRRMTRRPAIFSVLRPSSAGATLRTGLGLKGANQIESSAMTTTKKETMSTMLRTMSTFNDDRNK